MQKRAKNLDDNDIAEIVGILDGWSGKLSWELFIEAIERRKHAAYTRQALYMHERIRHAFALRKKGTANGDTASVPKGDSPELQAALQRLGRLENETARLQAENQRLLDQFAHWVYNAHTRGLGRVNNQASQI